MKKLLFIIIAALIATISVAQDSRNARPQPKKDKKSEKRQRFNTIMKQEEEEGEIVFHKHSIFGIKLATDGYGISYEKGKYISQRKTNILQFEFNEKLSNKEEKITNYDIFGNVSEAKFGKANNFYQLKVGLGQQYRIGGKANKNGVAVTALYAGGLSLGLLKPYYVDVTRNTNTRDRITFADTGSYRIIGASGFTVGWNELKLKPGAHAKAALRFDYGRFNETVAAIEAGVNAEYYSSKILQMVKGNAYRQEKQFFFNAYVSLLFGRRK